jgi:CRISPR system Cascade subunit CasE
MIITKARLSRAPGTQGSLAKVLLAGTQGDRNHGLVWSLFSGPAEGANVETRDFQFREAEPGVFIVVSKRQPEDPHGLWSLESKPYEPAPAAGDRLGFVLRANPAMAVPQPGEKRGKRVDAIMHAKSKLDEEARKSFGKDEAAVVGLEWLTRRGPNIGVAFDAGACSATGYAQVRIPRPKREKTIEFSEIEYAGAFTVADPDKLKAALFNGIGKAKAYGCGLMLVRRL